VYFFIFEKIPELLKMYLEKNKKKDMLKLPNCGSIFYKAKKATQKL